MVAGSQATPQIAAGATLPISPRPRPPPQLAALAPQISQASARPPLIDFAPHTAPRPSTPPAFVVARGLSLPGYLYRMRAIRPGGPAPPGSPLELSRSPP